MYDTVVCLNINSNDTDARIASTIGYVGDVVASARQVNGNRHPQE